MDREKVSYIIPLWFKTESWEIEASLNSLKSESSLISEIIIVFDGHKSFSKEFKIPDEFLKKIIFVYCFINRGPGIARNKGSIFSKSKYLFFLDSGDLSCKNRISKELSYLKKYNAVYGDIIEILPNQTRRVKKGAKNSLKAKKIIAFRSPYNNVTLAIRKKDFYYLGGFSSLRFGEDWILIGKILKNKLKIISIDQILVEVNIGSSFLERRTGIKILNDIFKCLKELKKMHIINYFDYIISLFFQLITRLILPKTIVKIIYKLLRN